MPGPTCLETPDLRPLFNLAGQLERAIELRLQLLGAERGRARLRDLLIRAMASNRKTRRVLLVATKITEAEASSRQPVVTTPTITGVAPS
jgi:hypothetical protein